MKAPEPHIKLGTSFNDWFYNHSMKEDNGNYWKNQSKFYAVHCYLWRLENYIKGQSNQHILKSTFGFKGEHQIKEELNKWYTSSLGAYNYIEIQ